MLALVKVQLIRTPYAGHTRGLRIRAAMNNPGNGGFGPSFEKPFELYNGSDLTIMEAKHVFAVERWLAKRGWRVERVGKIITAVMSLGQLHMNAAPSDEPVVEDVRDPQEQLLASIDAMTPEQRAELLAMLSREDT